VSLVVACRGRRAAGEAAEKAVDQLERVTTCAYLDREDCKMRKVFVMATALDVGSLRFGDAERPFLSPRRVAEQLGVTLTELAGLIGVARNTLTAQSGARKVDAALSPLVRVLAMASEMAGSEQRAAIWFKH